MEKLLNEEDIENLGFIKTFKNIFLKEKTRYIKCMQCGCWSKSNKQPNAVKKIVDFCFWCNSKFTIKLI